MNAILIDIEGTVSPIDFVHQTLFPYSRARIAGFVQEHFDGLRFEITQLAAEAEDDGEYPGTFKKDSANSVADYLKYLIDNDRKSTPLKSIQGKIWEIGYTSGELVSKIYKDVPHAFRRWKESGKTIAVYSSGSVLAQQMIFKYSDQGDLASFITAYFDTNIGHKGETESYQKIAAELGFKPSDILFVSDIVAELEAAAAAGFAVALSLRPDNPPLKRTGRRKKIADFDQLP